jgi:hypothetical protein
VHCKKKHPGASEKMQQANHSGMEINFSLFSII